MKKIIPLFLSILIYSADLTSQSLPAINTGRKVGLEITTGLQGSLSIAQLGINYYSSDKNFITGIGFREMSSITWVTFINKNTNEEVSFHPVILAGAVKFGGCGNTIKDLLRLYGYFEILLGHTFTPYDSYFYDQDNLIGPNLTYGLSGNFGIEFISSDKISLFIESGGGFKSILVENKENPYAIGCGWIGSGATIRIGTIIYLK